MSKEIYLVETAPSPEGYQVRVSNYIGSITVDRDNDELFMEAAKAVIAKHRTKQEIDSIHGVPGKLSPEPNIVRVSCEYW